MTEDSSNFGKLSVALQPESGLSEGTRKGLTLKRYLGSVPNRKLHSTHKPIQPVHKSNTTCVITQLSAVMHLMPLLLLRAPLCLTLTLQLLSQHFHSLTFFDCLSTSCCLTIIELYVNNWWVGVIVVLPGWQGLSSPWCAVLLFSSHDGF